MLNQDPIPQIVVSAEEMRAIDCYTINTLGIAGLQLMANAGAAAAKILLENYLLTAPDSIAIFCGPGNNGGDGFFVARCLWQAGVKVSVFFVGQRDKQTADAKEAQRLLQESGVQVEHGLPDLFKLRRAKVVVDALYGTGMSGVVREPGAAAIKLMNDSGLPILSLDIPSGLSSDDFKVAELFVHANHTVAFGFAKISQVVEPTRSLMGKLHVADIGFPAKATAYLNRPISLLTDRSLPLRKLQRKSHSHKGTYGHVLVIGGSRGMYGAPVLAAQAALYAGAGLVTVVTVGTGSELMAMPPPEVMTERIIDERGYFQSGHVEVIEKLIATKKISVIVLGMGFGMRPETIEFTRRVLARTELPIVLDADGLRALDVDGKLPKRANTIVTPHAGEYRAVFGNGRLLEDNDKPISQLSLIAQRENLTIVHKSSTTVIADPEGHVFVNTTGNPAMAKAGMGDSLAGIIGAFCAQGLSLSESACFGVYLHGAAGDICASDLGEIGVTASGVATRVSKALQIAVIID